MAKVTDLPLQQALTSRRSDTTSSETAQRSPSATLHPGVRSCHLPHSGGPILAADDPPSSLPTCTDSDSPPRSLARRLPGDIAPSLALMLLVAAPFLAYVLCFASHQMGGTLLLLLLLSGIPVLHGVALALVHPRRSSRPALLGTVLVLATLPTLAVVMSLPEPMFGHNPHPPLSTALLGLAGNVLLVYVTPVLTVVGSQLLAEALARAALPSRFLCALIITPLVAVFLVAAGEQIVHLGGPLVLLFPLLVVTPTICSSVSSAFASSCRS